MSIEISGLNIQLRVQAPHDLVLTTGLNAGEMSAETVKAALDLLTEVAEREAMKGELAQLRATVRRNEQMLLTRTFEKQIADLRGQRAKFDAEVSQRWLNTSHRGEPKLSGAQKTQMDAFEAQIQKVLQAKHEVENGLLLTLWQIDCLQARIAGQPEPPMPEEVTAAVADLEMPEDVGFTPQLVA